MSCAPKIQDFFGVKHVKKFTGEIVCKTDNQSPDFVFEVLEIRVRGRNSLFELNGLVP